MSFIAMVSIFESTLFVLPSVEAVNSRYMATQFYVLMPTLWLVAVLLVIARQLLRQPTARDTSIKESETFASG
jgi:uncharacterized membrane protein